MNFNLQLINHQFQCTATYLNVPAAATKTLLLISGFRYIYIYFDICILDLNKELNHSKPRDLSCAYPVSRFVSTQVCTLPYCSLITVADGENSAWFL